MALNTSTALKRKAEDPSPRFSKRLKMKARKEEAVTISSTLFCCSDIVSELLSFLDAKSLLQFSCVDKDFSSLLTYNYVVRAAMMSGGYVAESLERMIKPIRDQTIWIPSPERLLRVVSGKRCEICCSSVRYVNPGTGLFLCNRCTVTNTEEIYRGEVINSYLDSKRVQRAPRKGPRSPHRFIVKAPMKDTAGKAVGPLVTLQDIEKMMTIKNLDPAAKVAAHIEECDTRQHKASEARTAILSAVTENSDDAVARKNSIRKAKLEGKKRFSQARMKKVDGVLLGLKAFVGDDVSWKSKLDNRVWMPHCNRYYFRDPILQGILKPMLKAPSKITKKILGGIPAEIQSVVDKRALMDQYIQRIINSVNDYEDAERAMQRDWNTMHFRYHFKRNPIAKILDEPLKNPHSLSEEELLRLCNQINSILNRKITGRAVIEKLVEKLEDVPFKEDVERYCWDNDKLTYGFRRHYIDLILREPLSKPEHVTEEKLNDLAQQVRTILTKKQNAYRKVNLLVEPTKKYTDWTRRLDSWFWSARENKIVFHNFIARRILNDKFKDLDNLTDETIVDLSKDVIKAFVEKYGDATA